MFNSSRILYFNNILAVLIIKTISKDFYCFNENSDNVQNFYMEQWQHNESLNVTGLVVRVAVILTVILCIIQLKDFLLCVKATSQVKREMETLLHANLWKIAATLSEFRFY